MEAQSEYPKDTDEVNVPESEQRVFVEEKLCGRCNKPKGEGEGFCRCGRPTIYTNDKEMCAKVDEYLRENQDEYITEDGKPNVNLPTIEGFALKLAVNKDTVNEWRKQHEKFSVSCEKIIQEQQKRLINQGLSGRYNSQIAKLILSSNHGMREKSDVTTDEKPIEGLAVSFVKPKE